MTRDDWLATHPYLQRAADLQAVLDSAVARLEIPAVSLPNFEEFADDFHSGVPLLRSSHAAIDLEPAEDVLHVLIDRLTSNRLPYATESGWLRYLGSAVLMRYLSPIVEAFARWREDEKWLRNYCPTCGFPPAMAQLVGNDPGRLRLLCCGSCGTRWRYRRTGCPFCENQDDHRLAVVDIEDQAGLRIDYCESCRGYLKTYNGEGSESVLLADWTSLHLDVLARDRGLKRLAASLYEL